MPCYKHNYNLVNNTHYLPASDIELGSQMWEWRTERKCEKCDVLAVNN